MRSACASSSRPRTTAYRKPAGASWRMCGSSIEPRRRLERTLLCPPLLLSLAGFFLLEHPMSHDSTLPAASGRQGFAAACLLGALLAWLALAPRHFPAPSAPGRTPSAAG